MPDDDPKTQQAADQQADSDAKGTDDTPRPATVEDIKLVADSIKEGLAAQGKTPVAPPADAPFDAEAELAAAYEQHQKDSETGDYGASQARLDKRKAEIDAELRRRNQAPMEENELLIGGMDMARRVARSENKDMFDAYGSEIEAEVASMPVTKRMNVNAWETAIGNIRMRHHDEIIAAEVSAKVDAQVAKEKEAWGAPINAPGAHQGGPGADTHGLGTDDLIAAKALRITPKNFAASKEVCETKHDRKKGGVPILPEIDPDDPSQRIKPGQF